MVAERVLEGVADDAEVLPDDIFSLLPDGSSGWTSLSMRSASRGGAGAEMTQKDVVMSIEDRASKAGSGETLCGAAASHFGFAARCNRQLIAFCAVGRGNETLADTLCEPMQHRRPPEDYHARQTR